MIPHHASPFSPLAFGSDFWSCLPDSIGPIVARQHLRTSNVSMAMDVGRRRYLTIKKSYAELIFNGITRYEARPASCRQLKNVERGGRIYFHYYREWKLRCDVVEVHKFTTLADMVHAIGHQNLMPRKKSMEEVVAPWL